MKVEHNDASRKAGAGGQVTGGGRREKGPHLLAFVTSSVPGRIGVWQMLFHVYDCLLILGDSLLFKLRN